MTARPGPLERLGVYALADRLASPERYPYDCRQPDYCAACEQREGHRQRLRGIVRRGLYGSIAAGMGSAASVTVLVQVVTR